MPVTTDRALVLARIDELGAPEVARRVAPLWGYALPRDAEARLSRWRAHVEGRDSGRDMSSTAFLQLLTALGLKIAPGRKPRAKAA